MRAAFDFFYHQHNKPWILEVSYGSVKEVYDPCEGYWDRELNWYAAPFDPYGWMVDTILSDAAQTRSL